jgi:ankyrin repeat protein
MTLALSYAVCSGHDDVLKLLFKKGTKVDSEGDINIDATFVCRKEGHEAVIKSLLETDKVNTGLKDENGWIPPLWVARKGDEAVVKLLLETDKVNPDLKDENG